MTLAGILLLVIGLVLAALLLSREKLYQGLLSVTLLGAGFGLLYHDLLIGFGCTFILVILYTVVFYRLHHYQGKEVRNGR